MKNIYLGDFKQSEFFNEYCAQSGKSDISFSKFKQGAFMCPCIQEPTMRVCVDEVETGMAKLLSNYAGQGESKRLKVLLQLDVTIVFPKDARRNKVTTTMRRI